MRISTALYHQQAIESISERSSAMAKLQEQLTTGKRINRASDDPIGAAEAERIRASSARMAMETRMMSFATGMLSQADGALAGAADSLQTARELMISAGNGSLQAEDRKSIAVQLRNVRSELLAIANQRDGAGGYIFGGQGSAAAPFTSDGTLPAAVVFEPTGGTQQTGLDMPFDTTVDGGKVFLGSPGGGGSIFEALDTLVLQLEDEAIDGAALRAGLDAALGATDAGLDRVLQARTAAGEQLRIMEARGRLLESGELQAASRLADISATDYAKVVSEMQTNQLAVDAAMRTYAQISRMSLFDYL
jgi:flagellar hook-associated protein 3 FlgL